MAIINGNGDDERLFGTNAADTINARAGYDELWGFGGDDFLYGGRDYDFLVGGRGNDVLNGGAGIDTASYEFATGGVVVNLATGTSSGNQGSDTLISIEDLRGSAFDDRLTGNDAANYIDSGAGNDTLDGRGGDDVLSAGRGNGTIRGGSGNDTVSYDQRGFDADSDLGVWVSLRTGTAHHLSDPRVCDTLASIENVEGTPFRDIIFGDDRANVLDGGIGRDVIYGGGGDDTVLGGPDSKVLHGGSGNDFVEGGTDGDRLYGDGGSDTLIGGIGDDILYSSGRAGTRESARSDNFLDGGLDDDTLVAGHGYDEMSGGSFDHDVFRWRAISDASERTDRITDFAQGEDRIDLSRIDADATTAANDAFVFRGTAASFAHPGEIAYEVRGETTYVSLNTDSDARAEAVIALDGQIHLTAGDFLL